MTGADELQALTWLEMANFNIEVAIQLFFENAENGIERHDSEAHKRSKKREFEHQDVENVRAPDQVKRSRLSDTVAIEESRAAAPIVSAFKSASSQQNGLSQTLASIFQAPLDLITQGGFESVREMAEADDRWLLVNIQKESEFSCHVLNRDLWGDDTMKNFVACNFIFWQQQDISSEGESFISRYKVQRFPFVAILDPRTGAIRWRKEGTTVTPQFLGEFLQDFVDRNSCPSGNEKTDQAAPVSPETVEISANSDHNDHSSLLPADGSSVSCTTYNEIKAEKRNGFSLAQVLQKRMEIDDATTEIDGANVSLKVKLPISQKQLLLQLNTACRIDRLVNLIAKEMASIANSSDSLNFEISFGLPTRNLSDILRESSTENQATLKEVGIDQSMLLHVRILQ